jgi:hypothetical protein
MEGDTATDMTTGTSVVIGGEKISAKDDYLKVISNIFYKINSAADSRQKPGDLVWILDFYTNVLINCVLDPEDRDNLQTAKEDIYQAEALKRIKPGIKVQTVNDLNQLGQAERDEAKIAACTRIMGEVRNYLDRYFGFETKLAVMM